MAGDQRPTLAVFDECVGELKLCIERFPAGDSFCIRPAGVAMDLQDCC